MPINVAEPLQGGVRWTTGKAVASPHFLQSSKDISSLASVTDVVLTTVASLKNSTKATMNTTVAKLQAILEEHKADVADQVGDWVQERGRATGVIGLR